jgi:hypothetical protein
MSLAEALLAKKANLQKTTTVERHLFGVGDAPSTSTSSSTDTKSSTSTGVEIIGSSPFPFILLNAIEIALVRVFSFVMI